MDEYRRLGIDLLSALEKVALLGTSAAPVANVPDMVDNQQSMTHMMNMMAGVKGAPV